MRRLMLAAFSVSISGCLSVHSKESVARVTPVVRSPASLCAGPVLVVDGVAQPSTCDAAKERQLPKCDSMTPIYVVDGVPACAKPASSLELP